VPTTTLKTAVVNPDQWGGLGPPLPGPGASATWPRAVGSVPRLGRWAEASGTMPMLAEPLPRKPGGGALATCRSRTTSQAGSLACFPAVSGSASAQFSGPPSGPRRLPRDRKSANDVIRRRRGPLRAVPQAFCPANDPLREAPCAANPYSFPTSGGSRHATTHPTVRPCWRQRCGSGPLISGLPFPLLPTRPTPALET